MNFQRVYGGGWGGIPKLTDCRYFLSHRLIGLRFQEILILSEEFSNLRIFWIKALEPPCTWPHFCQMKALGRKYHITRSFRAVPRKLLATLYGVRPGLGLNHLSLLSGPCHWRMGELFVPFWEVESLGISGVSRSQTVTGYCAGWHYSG